MPTGDRSWIAGSLIGVVWFVLARSFGRRLCVSLRQRFLLVFRSIFPFDKPFFLGHVGIFII